MSDYTRQIDVFDNQNFTTPVHIIGAGATGSWVVLMLAKMGIPNIHVWDFDKVEEHNLPNQAFRSEFEVYDEDNIDTTSTDIGRPKATAINDVCYNMTGNDFQIKSHIERVDGSQRLSGIVFMLTDTMSSRKEIYEKAIKNKVNVKLLIETRMDLRGGFVYCIDPSNPVHQEQYEQTLYTDEESVKSACGTSQSLIATAMEISAKAVWQLIKFHNNTPIPNCISIASEGDFIVADTWR